MLKFRVENVSINERKSDGHGMSTSKNTAIVWQNEIATISGAEIMLECSENRPPANMSRKNSNATPPPNTVVVRIGKFKNDNVHGHGSHRDSRR